MEEEEDRSTNNYPIIWHCHTCGKKNYNESFNCSSSRSCKVCGRDISQTVVEKNPFHGTRLDSLNPLQVKRLAKAEELREGMDAQLIRPLHVAAANGDQLMTRTLLEAETRVHVYTLFGWSNIHLSAHAGDVETLVLFLDAGADKDDVTKGEHLSPLMIAAKEGNASVCQELLTRGANFRLKDKAQRTVLHHAAMNGHVFVGMALLEYLRGTGHAKTLIDAVDVDGWNAKQHADLHGHDGFVKLVIAAERQVSEVVVLPAEKYHNKLWLASRQGLESIKQQRNK